MHAQQLEYFSCKDEIFRNLLRREIIQHQRHLWRIFSELFLQTFSKSYFFFSDFSYDLLSDTFLVLIIIIFCSVSQLLFLYQYFYFYLLQPMNPCLFFIFWSQTFWRSLDIMMCIYILSILTMHHLELLKHLGIFLKNSAYEHIPRERHCKINIYSKHVLINKCVLFLFFFSDISAFGIWKTLKNLRGRHLVKMMSIIGPCVDHRKQFLSLHEGILTDALPSIITL